MSKFFFTLLLAFLSFSPVATCAVAPSAMEKSCKQRIDAIGEDNFTAFVSGGTLKLLKTDKHIFDDLVTKMGPAILAGYHLQYLGERTENAHQLYSWRVKYGNGKISTATLVMKADKVAGFWLE